MKNLSLALVLLTTFFLTGCFEDTQEITIKDNDSGSYAETMDLSMLTGIIKMALEPKQLEEIKSTVIDSTLVLGSIVDSITNLSADEKSVYRKATIGLKLNMEDEKFIISMKAPFSKSADIGIIKQGSPKLIAEAAKRLSGAMQKINETEETSLIPEMPESPTSQYFKQSFSPGIISNTLDKEKYATIGSDSLLQSMKQMVDMGMAPTYKTIFHLPRPAKNVTGKKATLSTDKKDVTVEMDLGDIINNATDCEYKIEY